MNIQQEDVIADVEENTTEKAEKVSFSSNRPQLARSKRLSINIYAVKDDTLVGTCH